MYYLPIAIGIHHPSVEFKFKQKFPLKRDFLFGAKDEIRTRDPDLGKVVLYQLSYFRVLVSANIGRKAILASIFLFF